MGVFFTEKVQVSDTCWLFTGRPNNSGYGSIYFNGKKMGAHRASWIYHFGEIPKGIQVCHKCDTPLCVNPEHLWLGTRSQNMKDAVSKGRTKHPGQSGKTHCKRGHEFNDKNTRFYRNGRWCRVCHKLDARKRRGLE